MSTIEQRVDRGIELLNKLEPKWIDKINLDTLEIRSHGNCVIAQVFGSYSHTLSEPFRGIKDYEYGFFPVESWGFDIDYDEASEELNKVWKAKITALRNQKTEGIPSPYVGDYKVKPKAKYEHRSTKDN